MFCPTAQASNCQHAETQKSFTFSRRVWRIFCHSDGEGDEEIRVGPRLYHAETQNSWVVSEARDTHGKKQEFNVSESAGIEQNTQFNKTSDKAKIHKMMTPASI